MLVYGVGDILVYGVEDILVYGVEDILVYGVGDILVYGVGDILVYGVGDMLVCGLWFVCGVRGEGGAQAGGGGILGVWFVCGGEEGGGGEGVYQCLGRYLVVFIEKQNQLLCRNTHITFIEFVRNIPAQRAIQPSFLHQCMKETQAEN